VSWIDLTLLMVMLLFGLRGYFRGLFREVFSLLGLVAGFIGAARYAEPLAGLVATYWNPTPIILKGVAFVICFFVIYLLFNVTGWLLHRSAKILFLQTVNRLGGVVLGVGKGTALAALVVFTLTSSTLVPQSARERLDDAYLVSPLARLADTLIRFGKSKIFINEPGKARAALRLRAA
jgi:membrane protein required for colicin V production